jgi:ATP-binding cassette subfamily B (MDR/TAP) protein 1
MSAPLGESSPKPDTSHPDPIADPHRAESLRDVVRDETMTEGATIPAGIPFPAAVGNPNVIPAIDVSSVPTLNEKNVDQESSNAQSTKPDMIPKRSSSLRHPTRSSGDHEKPTHPASSSSLSDEKSGTINKPKKKGFFARKSKKDEDDKKDKEKEAEADSVPPVSFLGLYRYMTWPERLANMVGILFACAAGAAQPLMTLIFGRLTQSFTAFSITANNVANGLEPLSALQDARDTLKTDSGHNALYLMAIGIGMFLTTWFYM